MVKDDWTLHPLWLPRINQKFLSLRLILHMVKDDWPPQSTAPGFYQKFFKLRIRLHMVKDDWPPPSLTAQDLPGF